MACFHNALQYVDTADPQTWCYFVAQYTTIEPYQQHELAKHDKHHTLHVHFQDTETFTHRNYTEFARAQELLMEL